MTNTWLTAYIFLAIKKWCHISFIEIALNFRIFSFSCRLSADKCLLRAENGWHLHHHIKHEYLNQWKFQMFLNVPKIYVFDFKIDSNELHAVCLILTHAFGRINQVNGYVSILHRLTLYCYKIEFHVSCIFIVLIDFIIIWCTHHNLWLMHRKQWSETQYENKLWTQIWKSSLNLLFLIANVKLDLNKHEWFHFINII